MTFNFGLFDDDGYPTEEVLDYIKKYNNYNNFAPLFHLCFDTLWKFPNLVDTCFSAEGYEFEVSTGGWSGNEDIIYALQSNPVIWGLTWWESHRGGHYKFIIPKGLFHLKAKEFAKL